MNCSLIPLFSRCGLEFFRKQQLRSSRDYFVIRLQALANKPTVLKRCRKVDLNTLESIFARLPINPHSPFVTNDSGTWQVHALLGLAGKKDVAGHRRAGQKTGRVRDDKEQKSASLQLGVDSRRGT